MLVVQAIRPNLAVRGKPAKKCDVIVFQPTDFRPGAWPSAASIHGPIMFAGLLSLARAAYTAIWRLRFVQIVTSPTNPGFSVNNTDIYNLTIGLAANGDSGYGASSSRRLMSFAPVSARPQIHRGKEIPSDFIISHGDSAELLDFAKQAFHEVPLPTNPDRENEAALAVGVADSWPRPSLAAT